MISTYSKDFFYQKKRDPNLLDFEIFFFKSPDFCDKFQKVANNIEGFTFFSTFMSIM